MSTNPGVALPETGSTIPSDNVRVTVSKVPFKAT